MSSSLFAGSATASETGCALAAASAAGACTGISALSTTFPVAASAFAVTLLVVENEDVWDGEILLLDAEDEELEGPKVPFETLSTSLSTRSFFLPFVLRPRSLSCFLSSTTVFELNWSRESNTADMKLRCGTAGAGATHCCVLAAERRFPNERLAANIVLLGDGSCKA